MSWKFLKKVLEEEPRFSRKFVNFEPGIGKVYLFPEQTGHKEIQVVESEKGLGWHAFIADDQLYLAPHNQPDFQVRLEGETGYDDLTKIVEDLAVIYTNDDFSGVALTKKVLEQMPQHLKQGRKDYLLADEYISVEEKTITRGVWIVRENGFQIEKALTISHAGTIYEMSIEAYTFPLIRLSNDTLVELERDDYNGSTKKKALNIRVACNLEVQREAILKMVQESENLNFKIKETLAQMRI